MKTKGYLNWYPFFICLLLLFTTTKLIQLVISITYRYTKMNKTNSAKFLLKLTPEERKQLRIKSIELNTSMQSLIRIMLHSSKTINDII